MNNNETLQQCFANLAKEMNLDQNPELFAKMTDLVSPVSLEADPESARTIYLEVTAGGEVTGEFRSVKNVLDLDFKGVLDLLNASDKFYGGLVVGAAFALTPYLLLLGVAKILYDGSTKDISSDNAEVLYAMYKLSKRRFTKEEVLTSYEVEFSKSLPDRHWARSLDMFLQLDILSRSRGNQYKLEEVVRPPKGRL